MTRSPADFGRSGHSGRRGAFTLVELITVIAIILILAGLVLGLAGHAQTKGATARATAEIQALSSAANNYQIDNGTYPRPLLGTDSGTKPTDALDPRTSYDSTSSTYVKAGLVLYQLLGGSYYLDSTGKVAYYYDTASPPPSTVTKPTVYYPFKDSQLKNMGNLTSGYIVPTTVTALIDPFGFSYGYSTYYQADMDLINAGSATPPPSHGFNPTFDLWSTAGYTPSGSAGKTYPAIPTSPAGQTAATFYPTLWIKNW